jgi:hypothetical protein
MKRLSPRENADPQVWNAFSQAADYRAVSAGFLSGCPPSFRCQGNFPSRRLLTVAGVSRLINLPLKAARPNLALPPARPRMAITRSKDKDQEWLTKGKEDKNATTKQKQKHGNYEFCEKFALAPGQDSGQARQANP